MKTTIDGAGRIVIPRPIRAELGLDAGGEVDVEIQGAAILIEPVAGEDLVEEGDLLVIPGDGQVFDDDDVRELRRSAQR